MPTRIDVENTIKCLLARYNAEYALLFGSYARSEETPDSDIDVVIFGGKDFRKSNIFAFAEDLRVFAFVCGHSLGPGSLYLCG